jgi:hypothetical protein
MLLSTSEFTLYLLSHLNCTNLLWIGRFLLNPSPFSGFFRRALLVWNRPLQ